MSYVCCEKLSTGTLFFANLYRKLRAVHERAHVQYIFFILLVWDHLYAKQLCWNQGVRILVFVLAEKGTHGCSVAIIVDSQQYMINKLLLKQFIKEMFLSSLSQTLFKTKLCDWISGLCLSVVLISDIITCSHLVLPKDLKIYKYNYWFQQFFQPADSETPRKLSDQSDLCEISAITCFLSQMYAGEDQVEVICQEILRWTWVWNVEPQCYEMSESTLFKHIIHVHCHVI